MERRHSNEQVLFYSFCGKVLPLLRNLDFLRYKNEKEPYVKWEKARATFQWSKLSRLHTMLPRHRPDFRTGLRFSFWAPEVPVLRMRKSHFHCFSSLQERHLFVFLFVCTSRFASFARGKWSNHNSKNCSEIGTVTWSVIWLWKLQFTILIFFTPL